MAGSSNLVDLAVGLAWPATIVFAIWAFQQPVTRLIGRIKGASYEKGKFSLEMHEAVERSGVEAERSGKKADAPSEAEVVRAHMIANAAPDPDAVRAAMEDLADQYDTIRRFNLPSSNRTAKMEGMVARMRTLAEAAFPLRRRFAESTSAGQRLATIAMLEVKPDHSMVDWLRDRVLSENEKPFVAYHALVALLAASQDPAADTTQRAQLATVAAMLNANTSFGADADRRRLLDRLLAATRAVA